MPDNNETIHDLHSELSKETEVKAPTLNSKMWNFDGEAEVISETNSKGETTSTSTASTTPEAKTEPGKDGKAPMSDAQKEKVRIASAETATASMDALIDLMGSIVINNKFKKRFTPDEFEKAQELQDKPKEQLYDEELTLRTKYDREKKRRDTKLKELPFEESDTNRLNTIFYNYFKISGKELSPEFLLVIGITSILIDKAQVVFTD